MLGLLFHNDLDGLISAKILINSNRFNFDRFYPIDYGKDHSKIVNKCDEFVILDFGENIAGDKTVLWIDHHLRKSDEEFAIIKEAPSCAQLLAEMEDITINKDILDIVNKIDSADYKNIDYADILFPELKDNFSKYFAINQMLMKNRKTNMALTLLMQDTYNPDILLEKANKVPDAITFDKYLKNKKVLMEKIIADKEDYIDIIENIPLLLTKKFDKDDWKGYDRNLFYFLMREYPYIIVVFEMGNNFNYQVSANPFNKNKKNTVYELLEDSFDDLKGHENILNFQYSDKEKALIDLDKVIDNLSNSL
jgi:hypothetical protein